ncbi:MAG: bifunctional phosphopantothenoylcysteine decarboxylase/phosphopantothenate--cysteine ligase CoaBC [Nitrospirae bacterium]|nr:bifunctional phosphopantothenoylcysteine decarboxylase/phosphopantothenate--cysteine ligase CoaBC [Nitrospirota bacterium]NTW65540.1 bifunctional phosphopantothenoylcysteine decarboxylase/phosphopantothenate--cysteine ligase CoaBC [Nitrospirota bacterium]
MLSGKRILLGVSGGIAAYKAVEVLRKLMELGAEVRVAMTRNAARFVAPLTFSALSGKPVLTDEFSEDGWGPMGHIAVTDGLDLALVAPATANIIGKLSAGIADDALSTALMAAECPVIIAPAMNERMFRNAFLQRNVGSLRAAGIRIVEPDIGALACGTSGQGRLASPDRIVQAVQAALSLKDLAGVTVLVTAGPTREPIDAARFISNPSTGKMGYALAIEARNRGADVMLISGPTHLHPPQGVNYRSVTTAAEMHRAVREHASQCQIIIMAAAVSDFRPKEPFERKLKKEEASLAVTLERTEDILQGLGDARRGQVLVGFAAETDDLIRNAGYKLKKKNLDLIVANTIGLPGRGFASDMNEAVLMERGGKITELPHMTKTELAARIMDAVVELKKNQGL